MFPSGCFHLLSEAISPYRGPTYHVVGWIFHFHPYPSIFFFFWEWASWVIEREGFGLCASWKYTTSSWLILLSSEFPNFTASTFRVMIITLKIIEGVVIVGSPRQEYMNIYIHIDRYRYLQHVVSTLSMTISKCRPYQAMGHVLTCNFATALCDAYFLLHYVLFLHKLLWLDCVLDVWPYYGHFQTVDNFGHWLDREFSYLVSNCQSWMIQSFPSFRVVIPSFRIRVEM